MKSILMKLNKRNVNVFTYLKIYIILTLLFVYINTSYASNFVFTNETYLDRQSSISTSVSTPVFNFTSKSQLLMDAATGNIIYANNENEHIYPASVTKIMTLLLLMEEIDSGKIEYADYITCSSNAASMGGSQIWFKENEKLTVEEALKAICIVSANDVTVAVAEHIGGTEENFVRLMNEKAKSIGMNNTNFVNSHGLDDDNHYTTALDIAIMSRELVNKHPNILNYTSIWMDSLREGTFELSSTNKLLKSYDGALGLKTGSTSKALFSLSAVAKRDNTMFISVVCTAPSSDIRLTETKQLLDYGFNNFQNIKIYDKGEVIEEININKNINDKAQIVTKDDISILVEKSAEVAFDPKITYFNNLKAPLTKGSVVGILEVYDSVTGALIGSSDLIIDTDISKSSVFEYLTHIFQKLSK